MKQGIYIVFIFVLLQACGLFGGKKNEAPIAKCGKAYLYPSDILGEEYTQEEVANISEAQINDWLVQQLWAKEAKSNLKDEDALNKELKNIENSLYIKQYKQQLLNENEAIISDEEILAFYKEHKSQFILDDEEFKIQMYVLPSDFNDLARIKAELNKDIVKTELTSYCEQNPNKCVLEPKWTSKRDLDALGIPDYLQKTSIDYEEYLDDSNQTILIRIIEKRSAGNPMSLELASQKIREILYFQKSSQWIKQKDDELLTNAQKSKNIEIYK